VSTTRREIAAGDAGSLSEGSLIFTLPFFHMPRDKHTRIPQIENILDFDSLDQNFLHLTVASANSFKIAANELESSQQGMRVC
jgi:hypothetical protein